MKKLILFLVVAMSMMACSSEPGVERGGEIVLSRGEENLVEAQNQFGVELFKSVVASEKVEGEHNTVISPLNIENALSMGLEINYQDFAQAVMKAYGADDFEQLHSFNKKVRMSLPYMDRKVTCNLNYGFWQNTKYNYDISDLLMPYYAPDITTYEFLKNNVKSDVNKWVEKNTEGKIKDILKLPVSDSALFVSAATMVVKGKWKTPFEKGDRAYFSNLDGTKTAVDYIELDDKVLFAGTDHMYMCGLPLGDGKFEMDFIMPRLAEGETFESYVEKLDAEELSACISGLKQYGMKIKMPKFVINKQYDNIAGELSKSLHRTLTAKYGEYPEVSTEDITVAHGIQVSVDEAGAEAYAATVEVVLVSSGILPSRLDFDHPYLYLIRENSSGLILVIGQITKFEK